jgi:hypothetical protein
MERAECLDRQPVSHYRANRPITAIFFFPQAVTVLDSGMPSREISFPRANVIVDAEVVSQDISAPAVVIALYPQDWESCIAQI